MSFLRWIKEALLKDSLELKSTRDLNMDSNNKKTSVITDNGSMNGLDNNKIQYEIVEKEILPKKIICPDCGGITLEGLEYCDKCGGELSNSSEN